MSSIPSASPSPSTLSASPAPSEPSPSPVPPSNLRGLVPISESILPLPKPPSSTQQSAAAPLDPERVSIGAPRRLIDREALRISITKCSPDSSISDAELDQILDEAGKIDLTQGNARWVRGNPPLARSLLVGKDPDGRLTVYLPLIDPSQGDRQIAEGGLGNIYFIINLSDGADFVIKKCSFDGTGKDIEERKDRIAMIENEKRIMQRFRGNENLVQLYFAFDDKEESYLVMENCEGGDLFDAINRHQRVNQFTPEQRLVLAKDIARGLLIMHTAGFTHRDLKPENIFLKKDPARDVLRAKIGDFGFARNVDTELPEEEGDVVCWSPEKCDVILDETGKSISHKIDDMWAVGLMVYSFCHETHASLIEIPNREEFASTEDFEDCIMENIANFEDQRGFPGISNLAVHSILEQIFTTKLRKKLTMEKIVETLEQAYNSEFAQV